MDKIVNENATWVSDNPVVVVVVVNDEVFDQGGLVVVDLWLLLLYHFENPNLSDSEIVLVNLYME